MSSLLYGRQREAEEAEEGSGQIEALKPYGLKANIVTPFWTSERASKRERERDRVLFVRRGQAKDSTNPLDNISIKKSKYNKLSSNAIILKTINFESIFHSGNKEPSINQRMQQKTNKLSLMKLVELSPDRICRGMSNKSLAGVPNLPRYPHRYNKASSHEV